MKRIFRILSALLLLSTARAATNDMAQSVIDLGCENGAPIDSGFVFVNGRYIDAPYIVAKRGNSIFINGELIETPAPWPLPSYTPSTNPLAITNDHGPKFRRAGTWTKERVVHELDYFRKSYEERLMLGDVYFFFPPNSHVSGTKGSADSMIKALLPILRSASSPEEKKKALLAVNLPGFQEWQMGILSAGFSASEQLDKRLGENERSPQPAR